MPKKKLFNKNNSTKFLLYTEDRDEDGKKIKNNILVPVTDHVPGNSLIISQMANLYAKSQEGKSSRYDEESEPKIPRTRKATGSRASKAPNLENILDQMEVISVEDEETDDDLSDVEEKLKTMHFFDTLGSCDYSYGFKVEVDEGSDVSEELGQFSDVESNFDFTDLPRENTLTSTKENCPENIKMLNEGFDKVLEEYDDNQIGALDDEEICGVFSTENEHIQNFIQTPLRKDIELDEFTEDLKEKILMYTEIEEEEKIVEVAIKKSIEFDCESIISTYSNQYNHPTIIKEPSKIKKIQVSNNPLHKSLTKSKLKQLESVSESEEESDDEVSVASTFNIRNKDETPEEKKERKRLFKEAKRESRMLKKENKIAFKDEKKRQVMQAINTKNNKGMRLI